MNAGVSANRLEILQIADAVAREKSIDKDIVIAAMADAMAKAARARYGAENVQGIPEVAVLLALVQARAIVAAERDEHVHHGFDGLLPALGCFAVLDHATQHGHACLGRAMPCQHLGRLCPRLGIGHRSFPQRMPEHGSGALNRPWFHAKNGVAHGRHFAPGGVPMQA